MHLWQHVELVSPYLVEVCQGPVERGFVDVAVQVEVSYDSVGRSGLSALLDQLLDFCSAGCYLTVV